MSLNFGHDCVQAHAFAATSVHFHVLSAWGGVRNVGEGMFSKLWSWGLLRLFEKTSPSTVVCYTNGCACVRLEATDPD